MRHFLIQHILIIVDWIGSQDQGRWQDVLRVAKEYLPNRLQSLQDEYDTYLTKSQGVSVDALISQGRQWEIQGEFSRAVDCYFKVLFTLFFFQIYLWNID